MQRQTIRHDYKFIFVQRQTIRHDYKLILVQRQTIRRDYKLFLCSGEHLATTINSFLCSGEHLATTINAFLCSGKLFDSNLMMQAIREMVGAAPVCPPERPRSDVSIRKEHVPTRKGGVSIHKRCMLTPKHVCVFADGCALAGRYGRAHRRRPYQPPSNPFTTQSSLVLCIGELFAGNLETRSHTRNGRGGACVPARTSAQRRFHP